MNKNKNSKFCKTEDEILLIVKIMDIKSKKLECHKGISQCVTLFKQVDYKDLSSS